MNWTRVNWISSKVGEKWVILGMFLKLTFGSNLQDYLWIYVESERKGGMKNVLRIRLAIPFTNEGKTRKMMGWEK